MGAVGTRGGAVGTLGHCACPIVRAETAAQLSFAPGHCPFVRAGTAAQAFVPYTRPAVPTHAPPSLRTPRRPYYDPSSISISFSLPSHAPLPTPAHCDHPPCLPLHSASSPPLSVFPSTQHLPLHSAPSPPPSIFLSTQRVPWLAPLPSPPSPPCLGRTPVALLGLALHVALLGLALCVVLLRLALRVALLRLALRIVLLGLELRVAFLRLALRVALLRLAPRVALEGWRYPSRSRAGEWTAGGRACALSVRGKCVCAFGAGDVSSTARWRRPDEWEGRPDEWEGRPDEWEGRVSDRDGG
ncbi:hypothetical protein K525DRAFT_275470 [Schizophyllum commune Loenen D]|nr:hypothetical protein K525DRAFT_275470 [Schizophyllum commune Loenen D]